MLNHELISQWEAEETFAFEGWDFSHLNGRWDSPEPTWDYKEIINSYLKDTDTLLDMGTGGGEFLLTLGHPYNKTFATEAYKPNFDLCMKTLAPLGITIKQTYTDENLNADDKLPFDNDFFDVIINRHESFDLEEVDRTLKQGGYFITQQVGNQSNRELMQRLNDSNTPYLPHHTLGNYVESLFSLGFQIIKTDETIYPSKIYDVGALVFYAKVIIWEFPGFSVNSHLKKLLNFQNDINKKGYIETTDHRFLIVAKKRNFHENSK